MQYTEDIGVTGTILNIGWIFRPTCHRHYLPKEPKAWAVSMTAVTLLLVASHCFGIRIFHCYSHLFSPKHENQVIELRMLAYVRKTASKGTLIFLTQLKILSLLGTEVGNDIFSLIPLKRSLFQVRKEVLPRTPASFIHKTALGILVAGCCHRAK